MVTVMLNVLKKINSKDYEATILHAHVQRAVTWCSLARF